MSGKKRRTKKQSASSGNRRSTKRRIPAHQFSFDLHNTLRKAVRFHEAGELQKAEKSYQRILRANPNHADTLYLLGYIAHQVGKNDKAVSLIKKAIENNPRNPIYHTNLGVALQLQGNLSEAISYYQKALQLKPDLAEANDCMGSALKEQGELSEAISYYQKALQLKPDLAEAYYNMGTAFQRLGKSDEAITCYRTALNVKPDFPEACSNLVFQLQETCAWQEVEDLGKRLDVLTEEALNGGTKAAEMPFVSLARGSDLPRHLAIAQSWSSDISHAMSRLKARLAFDFSRSNERRITVGYLSNAFGDHPMSHLMLSLFGLHDRNEFQIHCYSYGKDDRSYYREKIRKDCDRFVDIHNLSYSAAAKTIFEDHVDILVDLKGHTEGNRLAICALRPAPVQARYLGLAGTTGANFFDYIITDKVVTPESHSRYYTEKFAFLPHCYQVNDHTQRISKENWTRRDFGLPYESFVFCSFVTAYKIDSVMFDCWMRVLGQIPGSVLWLLLGSEAFKKNLRRESEARGVNPERIIFAERLPKDKHLARLSFADLALDTRLVSGAATTSDALWAGVPVITLRGTHFASRMSASIVSAIGLSELIAYSLEEYEALAVRLARNLGELQSVQQKLAKKRLTEPLFDTPRFTRNLERAYQEMWRIFLAGEEPRGIEVVEN